MKPGETRVLLVDDDPSMLRILSKWLDKAGYPVRTASDGNQALERIREETPDYVITDWEMPNMNGLELCRAIRRLDLPHYVYITFLTVKSAPHEMIEGLEVGADDFLSKPVYQGELLARLRAGGRMLELERRLSQMARTDPLTGLLTQRTFFEALEKQWQRARRDDRPLSCVMLDIDFFKRINDVHGHPAGDAVLRTVADVLHETCPDGGTVCRCGGEEFCAMLPDTTEQQAGAWAEETRKRLAATKTSVGAKETHVTASFGAAEQHDDTQTCGQLVDLADQALLCAKQSGRDRVVCYEQLNESKQLELEGDASQAGLFEGIEARHVMTPIIACLREDETVGQAAAFFLRSRINSTPVVNAQGMLTGILSEKDLLAAMVTLDCWTRPVREVMKPEVICYEEGTPIRAIYEFICRVSIRRVVIAKDGRPTGTISRGTLLRWFRNLVIAKGLLEHRHSSQAVEDLDPARAKQRLAETTRELTRQASDLQRRFHENTENLVPYLVGGATGMQELCNDLLAYSRSANPNSGLGDAVNGMLVDGTHMD